MCDKLRKYEQLKMQFYLDCVDFDKPDNKPYIYIYIYIYIRLKIKPNSVRIRF